MNGSKYQQQKILVFSFSFWFQYIQQIEQWMTNLFLRLQNLNCRFQILILFFEVRNNQSKYLVFSYVLFIFLGINSIL